MQQFALILALSGFAGRGLAQQKVTGSSWRICKDFVQMKHLLASKRGSHDRCCGTKLR